MVKRTDASFLNDIRMTLYTAVVSDVLDEAGLRNQGMTPRIRPLDEGQVLAGFARTALYREVFHVTPGENPYELEIKLIDDLRAGDVAVLCCGGSKRIAPWGELLSTASRARGAAGAVMTVLFATYATSGRWVFRRSTPGLRRLIPKAAERSLT